MQDHLHIGPTPAGEDCAQIGADNFFELNKLELAQFKQAIIQKLGEPPEGARFGIKDHEVVVFFDRSNKKACDYAYLCESESPLTWEEVGMKAPRVDDPEFTKTELIEVPADIVMFKKWQEDPKSSLFLNPNEGGDTATYVKPKVKTVSWNGEAPELCDMRHDPIVRCQSKIGNEFFDARTKQGPWGNLCPKCFARYGYGLGTGYGQRFKKATDGNFYKVEG